MLNPYNMAHDQSMNAIEHIGKYVIPELNK
jgi:hypothetical protein